MYLLDTDVLSNLLRREPSSRLIARLAAVPWQRQFTSSITVGELIYGASRMAQRSQTLRQQIEERLLANVAVLPFDAEAAFVYGELRADLERRGSPVGDADLRIASIALARSLIVVTGNVRHFERVPGLPIENWLE